MMLLLSIQLLDTWEVWDSFSSTEKASKEAGEQDQYFNISSKVKMVWLHIFV